jgi:hypothetical protein
MTSHISKFLETVGPAVCGAIDKIPPRSIIIKIIILATLASSSTLESSLTKAGSTTMEYFNDGYDTPEREHSPLRSRSRQTSPVSAVEYEFFIEHETNRNIVLRCIDEEQNDLRKESTASKAVFKANLMKAKRESALDRSGLQKLELEYQRSLDAKAETEAALSSLEEERATQQEILQCQMLNVKLLKDYFLKDKEWKERTTFVNLDAGHFVTNLFIDTTDVTKKEATLFRHRLEHVKYLYARALTSHRKSSDQKSVQHAARMKSEAIQKFNNLNGIEAV